jgi:hypothetical protein
MDAYVDPNKHIEARRNIFKHTSLRATSHTRLRARDQYTSSTHWWKRRSRSKFTSHYAEGTNGECESNMDKSTWVSIWHQMDLVYGRLDYFRNHLLLVGLTQNEETVALRTLTTVGLLSFIMCEQSMNTFKALIFLIIICNTYIHIYIIMGIIRIYVLQGLNCFNTYIRPLKF